MIEQKTVRNVGLFGTLFAAVLLVPISALSDEGDPPSRVARLAYTQGAVSFEPAGTSEWVSASVNRPMTTGDRIWSDRDGRVEMQLAGSLLRLSNNSGVSFLNLSDNVTQVQLSAGTLVVHVRRLEGNDSYEIDTPNLAFSILRPGIYQLTVDERGNSTAVSVRSGEAEVTGGGTSYALHSRDRYLFSGTDQLTATPQSYDTGADPFDAWSTGRDSRYERSVSSRYVSPDVVGYEDLDEHGTWRATPEYGNVWYPRTTQQGWAPYHDGHWAYIEPWGYTWVDDQPWGFAPFHYGRWISAGGSWGWVPSPPQAQGVEYVRPVYAPALVAWIGVGAGVAWFALGPREVYVPSYPVSRSYINNVNVSNTNVNTTVVNNYYNTTTVNNNTTVSNVSYVNRSVPGAVAATTSQAFISAQPVARNAVHVDQRAVTSAPVQVLTPAITPTRQSVLGTSRAAAVIPPQAIQTRIAVAKAPPPPPPPPFEKRQEAINNNGGKPLSTAQVRQIVAVAPPRAATVVIAPPARPAQIPTAPANRTAPTPAPAPAPAARAPVPPPAAPAHTEARPSERAASPPPPATSERRADRPAPAISEPRAPAPPVAVHPNELPPVVRPAPAAPASSALEQRHQQEQEQLRAQHEQERQKIQQQQDLEHQQLAQKQAEQAKAHQQEQQREQQVQQQAQQQAQLHQQLEQQHAQQTQQLQQKHQQEQQLLQERQQQQKQQLQQQPPTQQQPQQARPEPVKPPSDRPPPPAPRP